MSIPTQSAYIDRKAKTTATHLLWCRGEQEALFAEPADFFKLIRIELRIYRAEVWSWQIDAADVIQLPKLPNLPWTDRHSKS
jgi:hypothetical protein